MKTVPHLGLLGFDEVHFEEDRRGPDELALGSFIARLQQLPPIAVGISEVCKLLDSGLLVFDVKGETVDFGILRARLLRAEEKASTAEFSDCGDFSKPVPMDWHFWLARDELAYQVRRVDVARVYAALNQKEFPWEDWDKKAIWLRVADEAGQSGSNPLRVQDQQPDAPMLSEARAIALGRKPRLDLVDVLDLLRLAKPEHFRHFEDCEVDEAGIRPKPLEKSAEAQQSGTEFRIWKEFEQKIRLDLPCMPLVFLSWCVRNGFADVLPAGFVLEAKARERPHFGLAAKPEDYAEALLQDAWTAREALCWLHGWNPFWFNGDIKRELPEPVDLSKRAIRVGRLTPESSPPRAWIEWAKEKGWRIPPELEAEPETEQPNGIHICGDTIIQIPPPGRNPAEGPEQMTVPEFLEALAEAHTVQAPHEVFRWLVESGLVGISENRDVSLLPLAAAQPEETANLAAGCRISVFDVERTYWLAGQDRFPWRDSAEQLVWKSLPNEYDRSELQHYGEFFSEVFPSYPPHDLKKLRKSLSCRHVICAHEPCDAVVNEPYVRAMAELLRNGGHAVDWNHWAELPRWTGKEAACLIYGVDPLNFQSPNSAVPGFEKIPLDLLRERITKLAQHAERTLGEVAPLEWLEWAEARGLSEEIHPRLTALVHRFWEDSQEAGGASEPEHTEVSPPASSDAPKFESAREPIKPLSGLETPEVAAIFAGTRWTWKQWKSNLSDCPKWLEPARVVKGRKGKHAATWSPIELAKLLFGKGIDFKKVDRLFQTRAELKPWKKEWEEYASRVREFYE